MSSDQESHAFPCVHCGMTLRASDSARSMKCPQCHKVFSKPRFPIDCRQEIESEQSHQLALRKLMSSTHDRDGFKTAASAFLHREPDNPHDPNAVCVKIANHLVGYIPNEHSRLLQRAMRQKLIPEEFWAPAVIYGGFQLKEGTFEPFSVWICNDTLESMIVHSLPEPHLLDSSPESSIEAEYTADRVEEKRPELQKSPPITFIESVVLIGLLCSVMLLAFSRFEEMKQRRSDADAEQTVTGAEIRKAKMAEHFHTKDSTKNHSPNGTNPR